MSIERARERGDVCLSHSERADARHFAVKTDFEDSMRI